MTRRPSRARGRVVTAFAVVALSAGSGVAIPAARAAGATTALTAAKAPAGKHDKLSPRLAVLSSGAGFASPRARARALSVPVSGVGSLVQRRDGRVLVEIRTADTSAAGVAALRKLGAHVVNVSRAYATVTATVAPAALRAIAADADVRYVSEELAPRVGRTAAVPHAGGGVTPATCAPIVSEGDSLMNVAAARTNNSIDGAGQTIGILSDSFNTDSTAATHAPADVAGGELPGPGNPCGYTSPVVVQADYSAGGQADEGRAMAQLAHGLAPGAHLAFATGDNGELDFASQINNLRTVNHASVIVDDLTYLDEPFFQDGPVANAANAASAAGVPYFSAAGNSNVIVGGNNVSSYEAPLLRSISCPAGIAPYESTLGCHNFDTTGGTDTGDDITLAPGGGFALDLQWAQPLGGVTSDYDVFVLDAGGTVVAGSNADNLASQKPYEAFGYQNTTGSPQTVHIVIAKYAGNDARLKFVLLGASGITAVQYNASTGGDIVGPSIFGHNGTSSVASTAAIPYDNANTSEDYSSRGPVTLYFQPAPSTTALGAPQVLDQPSFAATDGVQTSFFAQQVGGVWRFYGTSAAAPQAAAIGALLQERDPALTPAQLVATLAGTARPVATNGTPDAVGGGYLDADAALASVTPLPGAPRILSVANGNARATLNWAASLTNPHFPITAYRITPIRNGIAEAPRTFSTNSTPTAVVTGLTNGASYAFTVAGINANGAGPESKPSGAITIGQPGRPSAVSGAPGDGRATVKWTAPTVTYGLAITGYRVTPFVGGIAQLPRTFNSTATTQTINGLTNGTSYQFAVAAMNATSTGLSSIASAAIVVGTPTAPVGVTASPGNKTATIHWNAPASNGSPITGYSITVLRDGSAFTIGFSTTTTTKTIYGLVNGVHYSFKVAALNARGNGPFSAASNTITVGAPTAPTNVTAATAGHQAVTVHWTAPANNGAAITSYIVTPYVGTVAKTPRAFSSSATTQTITGLPTGLQYTFRVNASNARGTGPKSAASNIVTTT